ncbi:MAG: bis-aminopropyl spermidine synthase family protein [Candidatus Diapherotrites archaeon]|nr:bis-aminopropyl spermidine synthase family protein [Candidatus Diapherotrites archaeon]
MKRIERQIIQLLSSGPMTFWEIVEQQDFTVKELIKTLNSMKKKGIIKTNKKIRLVKQRKPRMNVLCRKCKSRGVVPSKEINKVMKQWKRIVGERLPEKGEYYQEAITPDSIAAKIAFMYKRADVEDCRILVLGDDDFFGTAVALTGMPKEVKVIDIDERIINKTNKIAAKYGLPLSAERINLANPMPSHIKGYDTFVAEPPEALKGNLAFISRAASALRENGSGYTTLTNIDSSKKKWMEYEKSLHKMNFVITDIIRNFIHYPELEEHADEYDTYKILKKALFYTGTPKTGSVWYKAHLVRIELVGKPKPLYKKKISFDNSFFMDEDTFAISEEMLRGEV